MLIPILLGSAIFTLTTILQVIAIVAVARFLEHRIQFGGVGKNFWLSVRALSVAMLIVFMGHLLQVGLWAWVFQSVGEFDDFATAFYHSAVNFSSLGYGDIVMSPKWRLLGALEAGSGVLMFGISTGVGFAMVNAIFKRFGLTRPKSTAV